jgi:hypothetical protein
MSTLSLSTTKEKHLHLDGEMYFLSFNISKEGQLCSGNFGQQGIPLPLLGIDLPIIKIAAEERITMVVVSNLTCFGKSPPDESICSGNGLCVEENKCSCMFGTSGNECQFQNFKCFGLFSNNSNVCSGNGICANNDYCVCKTSYGGLNCEYSLNGTQLYTFGRNNVFF